MDIPSGWAYLHSDSESDGEGEYSPVTLDGQLVCYRHLRISCTKCCVDYSPMAPDSDPSDSLGDDDDDDFNDIAKALSSFGRKRTRGTGRVIPTKFKPPSPASTPASIFQSQSHYSKSIRFVDRKDPRNFIVFTDGACLNNGQANPKAGWAFVYGSEAPGDLHNQPACFGSSRLETTGPFGDMGGQTSNRAELRAVIGALRFRHWPGEGFKTMVIATDSEYVVEGATAWVKGWTRKGWKTRNGGDVKNKDLWECLLGDIERFQLEFGMKVELWRIPRELNDIADAAAKTAAERDEITGFRDILGILG